MGLDIYCPMKGIPMRFSLLPLTFALVLLAGPAAAAGVSTHVLDLARGVGGSGVPVVLEMRAADGAWAKLASATTDANGRVRAFDGAAAVRPGTYRLRFDMSAYPAADSQPFFPEIDVVFRVSDAGHYHVPVVVSPFGYSTYRGN